MKNAQTGNRNSDFHDSKPSINKCTFLKNQMCTSKIPVYVPNPVIQKEGLN